MSEMERTATGRFGKDSDMTYRSLCSRREWRKPELLYRLLQKSIGDMGLGQGARDRSAGKRLDLEHLLKADKAGLSDGLDMVVMGRED